MFFQKIKKLTVGLILSVFIFSSLVGFVFTAQSVNAQMATVVTGDIPAQTTGIMDMIKNGWKVAVLNAAQQGVSYFLRKVAYDSAVWVASGNKGQKPFFEDKGFGDYMSSVASDAAGTGISELGKGFGLDLCKIPDVKIDLAFKMGLHYNYGTGSEPNKPACNWSTFKENWDGDAWASKYGDGSGGFDTTKAFNASFSVEDAPLGIAMKTSEKIDRLVAKQSAAAQADRIEGQGFKTASRLISGDIKTPSQVIAQESKANSPSEQNKKSEAQIAAAMGAGAYEIIPSTLSLFLNTLTATMLKNFKENGMLPFGVGSVCLGKYGGPSDPSCNTGAGGNAASDYAGGVSSPGRAIAEAAFSEFLVTNLNPSANYNVLAELGSCESHGLYNCRADQQLILAINQASTKPVTIREAMDQKWLNADAKLLPPSRFSDNQISSDSDKNCFNSNNNYCYSNIQVLRQLGVFPLGFEIAAKNSDPDNPWTLNDVVNGFYKCEYSADGKVLYNPEKFPFCHLVDPNWVIKLPQTRCDSAGYGPTPLSANVPDRVKECVDLKSCVGKDKSNNCIAWGNCLREKNVWKFDATECNAQFATCRTFSDNSGQSVSYLYRTLNTEDCDQSTAGCAAYSLEQNDAGQWKSLSAVNYGNYSTGIYLNKNVSTDCASDSIGCSAFKLAGDAKSTLPQDNTPKYFKKAPDYLHCYDVDADQSTGTQWPQTFSDIFKMKPRPECKNYAKVCIADEVGCAEFKLDGDPNASKIPGKFTPALIVNDKLENWNDQCNQVCAGYAGYREMPSNYSSGTPLAYIIPPSSYNEYTSGKTCKKEEVSCSSFTNMSATENGGEKVEYFTDLRNCIKPDATKQKNFYTYEGSDVGGVGYQLKSFTLEKDPVTGGPATVFLNSQEKNAADILCNSNAYKAGLQDADCRQFNDEKGVIYYAMLSHTVVVSTDCTSFRLNSTELAGVNQCFGKGEFINGACYYNGLPTDVVTNAGASKTCAPSAVSCRAYKGNNGNNTKTISLNISKAVEDFENQTDITSANNWSATAGNIVWSTESTKVGEHSLGYAGNTNNTLQKTIILNPDSIDKQNNVSYSLSFWAKGSGVNVDVSMTNKVNGNNSIAGTITANTSWQYFSFSLVELQSTGTSTINFNLKKGGNLFLDNIRLTKVSEYLYLVKDSLKVDPICDDNLDDNLPGAALGCRAYSGPPNNLKNKDLYYLTNFSFLCREGAIGCTAFIDTFNKNGSGPRAYNVSISGTTGTKVTKQIGNDTYSCQIEQGKTSCNVNVLPTAKTPDGHTQSEILAAFGATAFNASTYYIPADTLNTTPIYLVASDAGCNPVNLGCTYAGLQKSTPNGNNKFETTTIKLDPALFEITDTNAKPILCRQEALGCNAYNSSQGEVYFKDPKVVGAKICSYNPAATVDGVKASGWFWKGVGLCGNTTTLATSPSAYCFDNSDCSANPAFDTCLKKDVQPCYPDYKLNNDSYGLWSFGNKTKYDNFVGECNADQNACTEFVDHNDNNKAYYFIKDNKISEGDCAGMASQKEGCAIFDETANPNKRWNTAATYLISDSYIPDQNSDVAKATKAPLLDHGSDNDANILIKVTRDRECAEWLQCKQSHPVWNDQLSTWKQVCEKVDRCDRLPVGAAENNPTNCSEFIGGQHPDSDKILTESVYVGRNVNWTGRDYDGFSILDMYPVEELAQYNISDVTSTPDWRLAKAVKCTINCPVKPENAYSCEVSGQSCGNGGQCINKICLRDPYGNKEITAIKQNSPGYTCRAYPESDSPFPNLIPTTKQGFSGVNKCSEFPGDLVSKDQALQCDCDYSKVTFANGAAVKYFKYDSLKSDNTYLSVCVGGVNNGNLCAENDINTSTPGSCVGGTCQIREKLAKNLGWRGQCLESDVSRTVNGQKGEYPCLSWLPIDKLEGTVDINDQNANAGFNPSDNTKYCLNGDFYQKPKSFGKCEFLYNVGCENKGCKAEGEKYCAKFPGFKLKPEADSEELPLPGEDPELKYYWDANDPNGPYCGGVPIGATGNNNCDGTLADGCRWECIPDEKYGKIGGWGIFSGPTNASDVAIGCRIGTTIDKTDVAWTDNIWKGKKDNQGKPFELKVTSKTAFFSDKLNFKFSSPVDTFARLGSDTNADLIRLMYCATKPFSMPFSDGSCGSGINLIDKDLQGVVAKNLTFGEWSLDSASVCTNDINCNGGAACEGVGIVTDPKLFKCQRYCKQASDCNQFNVSLGSCEGYIPASGTQVEKLGICQTLADGVCEPKVFGDKTVTAGCYLDPNTGQQVCTQQKVQDVSTFCQRTSVVGVAEDKAGICLGVSNPGTCNNKSATNLIGTSCLTNDKCYSQMCISNGINKVCSDINAPKIAQDSISTKINSALKEFQQIFAKINISQFWTFSTDTQKYIPLQGVNTNVVFTDITDKATAPPAIHPVGPCDTSKDFSGSGAVNCQEIAEDNFTVNDKYNGNVYITSMPHAATIKFYMNADKNQMPIKKVMINWNDGKPAKKYGDGIDSSLSNQRGSVIANQCLAGTCAYVPPANSTMETIPSTITCANDLGCKNQTIDICHTQDSTSNFGNLLKTTCENNYFTAFNTYDCKDSTSEGWDPSCGGDIKMQKSYPGGCCVFKPFVQVEDNWGWCNGTSGGTTTASGVGCYNGDTKSKEDFCLTKFNSTANTPFKYKILVAPSK